MLTDNRHVIFGQTHQITLTSRISLGIIFDAFCTKEHKNNKKCTLSTFFSIQKPKGPKLTVPKNRSRSTQGHCLYNLFQGLTPKMLHAKFQSNRPSGCGEEDFLKIFKVFSTYEHGGHLGHVT